MLIQTYYRDGRKKEVVDGQILGTIPTSLVQPKQLYLVEIKPSGKDKPTLNAFVMKGEG